MKNSIKITALFIFLSLFFSSFAGCSNSGTTETGANLTVNNNAQPESNVNSPTETVPQTETAAKSGKREMPPELMRASLESLDGGNFRLEDKKGKVVLINLWGIWCGPCIKEMPHLIELQDKYRDKGFEVLGLNVGDEDLEKESAENIKVFAEKMKLNYELGWAEDSFYKGLLDVSKFPGVPQSFLLDREGKLDDIFVGGAPVTLAKMKDKVSKLMETN
jgi:thiol-disulfide isomerase/thioredoxin